MHIWNNQLLAGIVDKAAFGKHGLLHIYHVSEPCWCAVRAVPAARAVLCTPRLPLLPVQLCQSPALGSIPGSAPSLSATRGWCLVLDAVSCCPAGSADIRFVYCNAI